MGITDDFFELGGNSLLAADLIGQLRHALPRGLAGAMIFYHPTVAELAAALERSGVADRTVAGRTG